jgi:hypothetical protein
MAFQQPTNAPDSQTWWDAACKIDPDHPGHTIYTEVISAKQWDSEELATIWKAGNTIIETPTPLQFMFFCFLSLAFDPEES